MKIFVVSSVGEGQTQLSAFDAALNKAGVYNYNLIRLSSVIPAHSKLITSGTPKVTGEWGDKLYIVQAEMRSETPGEGIAAGIGWYQFEPDQRGVFVEHEAVGKSSGDAYQKVEQMIRLSLEDLCKGRNMAFDDSKINHKIISVNVKDKPTCALVIAVYQSEGWK